MSKSSPEDRLNHLRGKLDRDALGARQIERLARNPTCTKLFAVTVVGSTPNLALKLLSQPSSEAQSLFALNRGNRFEASLLDSGAARLIEVYREVGRLAAHECKVVNVADHYPSSTANNLMKRVRFTHALLRQKLARDPQAPNIIIKPRIRISGIGFEHTIEPDALVASDTEDSYRVVEIKSYPDRSGKTSEADIRSACRQAAVGVVALKQTVSALSSDAFIADKVAHAGDLILSLPGVYRPSLREMTLESEIASIERIIADAPQRLTELEAMLRPGAALSDPGVFDSLPFNYLPNCREHCALAKTCKARAVSEGNPVLLGLQAKEELAAAGSIGRAIELMLGVGPEPRTYEETILQRRLQEARLYGT